MLRRIIKIDREKCNGCGACAEACHEGAIEMIDGKATLTREDYCDGLGDCLPACPVNAITFEEREAPAYDEAAVLANKAKKAQGKVTYSITKAVKDKKSFKRKFSINKKTGKITVKKGIAKGAYKVTVKAAAKGNANYKPGSKAAVITIKVT